MEKHLLLAVGDDPSASFAIRFTCHFFRGVPDVHFTLLHVTPASAAADSGYRLDMVSEDAVPASPAGHGRGNAIVSKARDVVLSYGFPADAIKLKVQPNFRGTVQDIVNEAHQGLYDAVVLGRRGLSRLEELFADSVTRNLLAKDITFPIWICKRPALDTRNILVCVDGSNSCYSAVDHVGFILANRDDHDVTLLHVKGSAKDPQGCAPETFIEEARRILLGNGLAQERIKSRIVDSSSPAETILREAESGRYAAVAVGRTGRKDHAGGKDGFMGSVAMGLLRKIESVALWVA